MLSLGLMDIDFFKKVNDTYGHDVGDEVLIEFAARLKQSFSQHFTVARFGGEELVIGFKGLSVEKTFALLDRFRMQLESKPVTTSKGDLTITVSTGVASFIVGESVDDMLQRADVALYEAKSSGRNLVCIA